VRKAVGGGHDRSVRPPTVGEWLEEWLAAKKKLRAGTVRSYASHIRLYYQPHIGYISINRLRVTDVASVFEAVEELNEAITEARTSGDPARRAGVKGRRLVGPATQQRIRATLRSAIGTYMKQHQGMLLANVASLLELPSGDRPKPLVWTDERVRAWQKDYEARLADARERASGRRVNPLDIWVSTSRPSPVMVWTPAQTQVFLARAARHRLYAMWRLIASRGLRRGEGCGLRRTDTDLAAAITSIRWQITQLGWDTAQGAPKSDAGERQVALDADTVADIRAHRPRQQKEKEEAGDAWTDSGFEFTNPDGTPLHPAAVTDAFELIAYLAGLPPIRLHDLRHGAATSFAAGHDMKVVQDTLGLSSITIAADTYTSVLPQLARQSPKTSPRSSGRPRPRPEHATRPQEAGTGAPGQKRADPGSPGAVTAAMSAVPDGRGQARRAAGARVLTSRRAARAAQVTAAAAGGLMAAAQGVLSVSSSASFGRSVAVRLRSIGLSLAPPPSSAAPSASTASPAPGPGFESCVPLS
ncbi:MAG TPA: hypothetical protein DHU96_18225, partial [Actinobacteria bacterium]|nr:hypothetical protein [Actinomycetota bacterium]